MGGLIIGQRIFMEYRDSRTPGAGAMLTWDDTECTVKYTFTKYFWHYLFLFPHTPKLWLLIHLSAGFIRFSSVYRRNMRALIQAISRFLRRRPHTSCMLFQSAGGY